MADLSEKDKELVEHLSRSIIAAGIFRGLECSNIAATQDAIHKIAKAFDVDLSISEDRMRFQEGCRKAALSYLESEDLIEAVKDEPGKVRYRIKPGREQEYKDAIFLAGRRSEYTKNLSHLIKALKKGKDVADTIKEICQVIAPGIAAQTRAAGAILGNIAAVAQRVTDICDNLDAREEALIKEPWKTAAQQVTEAVYKTTERDDIFKGVWDIVKKVRDLELFKMRCESVNNIHDAELTKRSKEKANKMFGEKLFTHSGSKETSEHPERRKSIFTIAADVFYNNDQMVDLFAAFADVDASIRPNGVAIKKENASLEAVQTAENELKDVNPLIKSIKILPGLMIDQIVDVNPQIGFLHRLDRIEKWKKMMPKRIYKHVHKRLVNKAESHYKKVQKKSSRKRDDLEKATMNIAHFNATNENSMFRGKNYAHEYAGLTLYRCGKTELLVEAMDFFRMNTLDKIWALSYMKAGMMESIHGIRYMGRQADANGVKYEPGVLESRAEDVFRYYTDGKQVHELDAVCQKMSNEFVAEHKAMLDRISVRRQKEGMPELQEITYISDTFNNEKDQGKKDHLDVELVDWKDIDTLDATDLYENKYKDGYFIKDPEHESVALFLFFEDRGIVALVDDYENVTDMKLTADSYHRYTENREVMKEQYTEPRDAMTIDKALRCIAKNIDNQKKQERIQGKWRPFVRDAIKNDFQPKCYSDGKVTRLALIDRTTGISMLINEQDPTPGYQSTNVMRFAREIAKEDYRRILEENHISLEDAKSIVLPYSRLNSIQAKILESVDKNHYLMQFSKASLQFAEMTNAENMLDSKKREDMTKTLTESISGKDVSNLKAMQAEYQYRCLQYQDLVRSDPVLARCKIAVPDCERDGDLITATTSGSNTLSINTQTMEVHGFDMNDQEMKNMYRGLTSAIMIDDDILENSKDMEMDMER